MKAEATKSYGSESDGLLVCCGPPPLLLSLGFPENSLPDTAGDTVIRKYTLGLILGL